VLHYTVGLTESLAKQKIELDVVTSNPLKISGVNVHFIPRLRTRPLRWLASNYERRVVIPKLLRRADIIHTNGARNADYALQAKKTMGKSVVHTAHGVPMPEIEIEKSQASFYQAEAEMLVKFNDNAIPIVSISNFCKKMLMGRLGIDSKVIYHGVDFKIFNPYVSGEDVKKRYSLKNEKLILSIMRMHPIKEPFVLVKAIPIVIKDFQNVKFMVIGEGPLLSEAINLSKQLGILNSYLFFINHIPFRKIPRFYGACDIFVHTAAIEFFGLVVLEAMACRKAVIVPDAGATSEIVGSAGLTFKHGDPEDLADKILLLLSNDELRTNMASKAFQRSKEFTWKRAATEYMHLYNSLL
jgi:glycosyltransferase involved in cell wall biosynthesis